MGGTIDNSTSFGASAQDWLGSLGKELQQGLEGLAEKLGLDGLTSDLDQFLAQPSTLDRYLPRAEQAVASPPAAQSYTVKKGDTLGAIAAKTGQSVDALARLNGLSDPDKLSIGQTLKVGGSAPQQTAKTTATQQVSAPQTGGASASGLSQNGMDFLYHHEAQKGVSNHLHWPKAGSGVTLGPGYDMKGRSSAEIERDLTAVGVDPAAARKAGEGAGLTGAAARDFAATNKNVISLTADQEKALLTRTVEPYAAKVRDLVKVPVTQNQYDALVSFAYNIGTGKDGFAGSTALSRLNDGDAKGAAEAMTWWNKSEGKVSQGLINRRADEGELFNTPGAQLATPAAAQKTDVATPAGNRGATSPDALAATIATRGDAQAKADLAAGHKVVVALRTDTDTNTNGGKGVYDDTIAVVWKDEAGRYQAKVFDGNTEPSGQYGPDGPKASRGSHTDANGDGKMDLGRLQAGTIRYEQESGQFLGNSFFRATRTQVAERDTNQDGRFTAADSDRIDTKGAGRSMLIHQGGATNTWSAGCQTIPKADFNDFLAALGGQKGFSYVLVDAK